MILSELQFFDLYLALSVTTSICFEELIFEKKIIDKFNYYILNCIYNLNPFLLRM